MNKTFQKLITGLKHYFNLYTDKEDEQQVYSQVSSNITFRGTNLWILIFAIFMASLGLNVNSTAVIIGAMLISPLMGPIIGMGYAIGINDYELLKRALKNYGVATLISVVTATIYFAISPLNEARSELLARTFPTLYDVLIAFFGGAAGVLALTTKSKGQVIPGVAIATALMPPLCTAGYGLASAQWSYFFGAFYLFFINTVFIASATFLGVKFLRFNPEKVLPKEKIKKGQRIIMAVVIITLVPASIMTVKIIKDNIAKHNIANFVNKELSSKGLHIVSLENKNDTLAVVALGTEMDSASIAEASDRMHFYGMENMHLRIIQAGDSPATRLLAKELTQRTEQADKQMMAYASQIKNLENELQKYTQLDTLSESLTQECHVLFPDINAISIGIHNKETVALIYTKDGKKLDNTATEKIKQWVSLRLKNKKVKTVFIP
ncbi:MAG: DUF389 domain-containing protein [Bacteroidales bacterium]|nr:DUF389 domain-containing protein [Bacteroidales bacterium]